MIRVISVRALREFLAGRPDRADAKEPLDAWHREAKRAKWRTPADIKAQYRSASIVANNRVVFNVAGNKYRLVAHINYAAGIDFIRFIGTHKEYDSIIVEEV